MAFKCIFKSPKILSVSCFLLSFKFCNEGRNVSYQDSQCYTKDIKKLYRKLLLPSKYIDYTHSFLYSAIIC